MKLTNTLVSVTLGATGLMILAAACGGTIETNPITNGPLDAATPDTNIPITFGYCPIVDGGSGVPISGVGSSCELPAGTQLLDVFFVGPFTSLVPSYEGETAALLSSDATKSRVQFISALVHYPAAPNSRTTFEWNTKPGFPVARGNVWAGTTSSQQDVIVLHADDGLLRASIAGSPTPAVSNELTWLPERSGGFIYTDSTTGAAMHQDAPSSGAYPAAAAWLGFNGYVLAQIGLDDDGPRWLYAKDVSDDSKHPALYMTSAGAAGPMVMASFPGSLTEIVPYGPSLAFYIDHTTKSIRKMGTINGTTFGERAVVTLDATHSDPSDLQVVNEKDLVWREGDVVWELRVDDSLQDVQAKLKIRKLLTATGAVTPHFVPPVAGAESSSESPHVLAIVQNPAIPSASMLVKKSLDENIGWIQL